MMVKLEWEVTGDDSSRAKVIGGWIATVYGDGDFAAVFVPDPRHEWGNESEYCRWKEDPNTMWTTGCRAVFNKNTFSRICVHCPECGRRISYA